MIWDHEIVGSTPIARTRLVEVYMQYSSETIEKCSNLLGVQLSGGTVEVEYGGFAKRMDTGEYELIFKTTWSELLCRNRTLESIRLYFPGIYDKGSVTVRKRNLMIFREEWIHG